MAHPANFIAGRWQTGGGAELSSEDPATGREVWRARTAAHGDINDAVTAARHAFPEWASKTADERATYLHAFRRHLEIERHTLAGIISTETGKPLWESELEVSAMIGKISVAETAYADRSGVRTGPQAGAIYHHRPHGVIGVIGPFTFPGHLPNGHIVPALLAGNTVVFKPSPLTPHVSEAVMRLWQGSGLPPGVLNLVQGDAHTGEALADHPGLEGLFFTGSAHVGELLHHKFARYPHKILVLQMGGNNPLVCWNDVDPTAAAHAVIASAFMTAGQRCTCARRLILPTGSEGDHILETVLELLQHLHVASPYHSSQPFMGPVIANSVADFLMKAQEKMVKHGATPLHPMQRPDQHLPFLTPGLVDVTNQRGREDQELFGPLLQVLRVGRFEEAIEEANATRFGLAAGLLSNDARLWHHFQTAIRAGIVNWNRQLTGASSVAPFGGIGASGNHRASAYYAADYSAYPVASLESAVLERPKTLPIGIY